MPVNPNAEVNDLMMRAMQAQSAHAVTAMPRYKCHKEVWALKIQGIESLQKPKPDPNCESDGMEGGALITPADAGFAPFVVGAEYMRKHRPQVGGYFVVYKDGYRSFSPARAFEDGYARIK